MTPETPWKVHMAKIVRVSAPSHFQVRKNIAVVNRENRFTCLEDVLGTRGIKLWIILLIEASEGRRQFRSRFRAVGSPECLRLTSRADARSGAIAGSRRVPRETRFDPGTPGASSIATAVQDPFARD